MLDHMNPPYNKNLVATVVLDSSWNEDPVKRWKLCLERAECECSMDTLSGHSFLTKFECEQLLKKSGKVLQTEWDVKMEEIWGVFKQFMGLHMRKSFAPNSLFSIPFFFVNFLKFPCNSNCNIHFVKWTHSYAGANLWRTILEHMCLALEYREQNCRSNAFMKGWSPHGRWKLGAASPANGEKERLWHRGGAWHSG